MELPQLLGSDYVLPAIIAIVVLLAVLGLLILHKRQKERTSATPGERPLKMTKAEKAALKAAAKPERSTRESRKATALATMAEREVVAAGLAAEGQLGDQVAGVDAAGEAGVTTEAGIAGADVPPLPAAAPPPGRGGRRTAAKELPAVASPTATLAADPLQRVLTSILQGWGDISAEDTNRLNVFRRDKVIAALAAVELPKEGRGNEYVRTRLTQLRRYANQMEQAERLAPPESAVHEFAGIGLNKTAVTPADVTGATAAAGATMGAAAAAFSAPNEPTPDPAAGRRRSWYETTPEDELPTAAVPEVSIAKAPPKPREWTTTPTGEDTVETEMSAGDERAAEFNWGVDEDLAIQNSPLKAVDLSWDHDPATGTPAALTPDAPVVTPAPPAEAKAGWGADEASRSAEAAVAAAAAAFWGSADTKTVEQMTADLGRSVSNAADLLALPAGEQTEMLVFLEPGELTKVFNSTGDRELKKAVIDTLEDISNTASLDAIRACLEDSDPEVQLHALDAAERMLGKLS